MLKQMDDRADLLRRAFAAYFRAGGTDPPGATNSGVTRRKGLLYVVLRSAHRTLAVYRVKNDGALRRLRRWPEELNG